MSLSLKDISKIVLQISDDVTVFLLGPFSLPSLGSAQQPGSEVHLCPPKRRDRRRKSEESEEFPQTECAIDGCL